MAYIELRWETFYPTAKISPSVVLCATTVTCARHAASRHFPSNSPFFTSQQRTSSFAPTIARPAPVWRVAPAACSSLAQIALDDAEVTRPNVFDCSNFLKIYYKPTITLQLTVIVLTGKISPSSEADGKFSRRADLLSIGYPKLNTGGDNDLSGSPTAHDGRSWVPSSNCQPVHTLLSLRCPSCFCWIIRMF